MKAYKVEVLIVDHDNLGADEIKSVIEYTSYSNDCISPSVMDISERDIGEWSDDHKLNSSEEMYSEYVRLFK